MQKNFRAANWEEYLPRPVCEAHPEYAEFYQKTWRLARDHVKSIPGMPQDPYMDEAFCESQVWIWDTCFMSLFCKFAQEVFPGVETFQNFYEVLYRKHFLPEIVPTDAEPEWTQTTPGVPAHIKVHIADNPPLFAFGEYENALIRGDVAYLKNLLYEDGSLQRHYEWFEGRREEEEIFGVLAPSLLINEEIGYRWEGGRSGMDNTPRGRTDERCEKERPNNRDMLWFDALCQQALSARLIARMFRAVGDAENAALWQARFEEKKKIANGLYWDEEDGFYYDIDVNTHAFYKVMTVASFWALTAGIASEKQARRMAEKIKDPRFFGGDVPLVSLSRSDADFSADGKYWRGSVWLPTAYAALKGLTEDGLFDTAHEAAVKLLSHMYRTYRDFAPHTVWECYSPTKCEPGRQTNGVGLSRPDFCGWSALGPVSVYIEYVLGFHTVDAFLRVVKWEKPTDMGDCLGIENLRFGDTVTDIVADGNAVTVKSNAPYTLEIDGVPYAVGVGVTMIEL